MNVYDFDKTIYDGESSVEFFLCYIKHDPKVLAYIPTILKGIVGYEKGSMKPEDMTGRYSEMISGYFKTCNFDFEPMIKEFWDKRMHKIKPFYKLQQRPDDLIITASPEVMMWDVCNRLGIKNLIGTDFDLKTGEIKTACFREEKLRLFKEAYPNEEIDDFYTDSMNDQFLFPISKRVFMVKGQKITQIK